MKAISNELLSEVLKTDKFRVDGIFNNTILLRYKDGGGWDYNVYEFAFKCKAWAYSKCYEIISYTEGSKIYQTQLGETIEEFYAESEIQAIFKACEWIMQQKDKQ